MGASKSPTKSMIDSILKGYIDCALWSENDDDGEPFEKNYSKGDIADSSIRSMRADIIRFVRANKKAVSDYGQHREYRRSDGSVWEHFGHDLWLTRNGHGTGFWDREYEGHDEIGRKLTEASKVLGSSDLYTGDGGELYVFPEK